MGNHKENMSCLQTCNLDHVMVGIHLASNGTNKLYTFHFVTSSSFWRLGCLKRLKVMLLVIVRLAPSNFASRTQPAGSLLKQCRSHKTICSKANVFKTFYRRDMDNSVLLGSLSQRTAQHVNESSLVTMGPVLQHWVVNAHAYTS